MIDESVTYAIKWLLSYQLEQSEIKLQGSKRLMPKTTLGWMAPVDQTKQRLKNKLELFIYFAI